MTGVKVKRGERYIVDTCAAVYRSGGHCAIGDSFGGDLSEENWFESDNCRRYWCQSDKKSGIAMTGSIVSEDDRSGYVRYERDLCEGYRKSGVAVS